MISTSYCQECPCGRSFDDTGAFTRHKKTCLKGKKHLANVLSHAKESYRSKKCRIEDERSASSSSQIVTSSISHHDIVDSVLGGTALDMSDTLGSMDTGQLQGQTKVLNEVSISGADQVCILFFLLGASFDAMHWSCQTLRKLRTTMCCCPSVGLGELTGNSQNDFKTCFQSPPCHYPLEKQESHLKST